MEKVNYSPVVAITLHTFLFTEYALCAKPWSHTEEPSQHPVLKELTRAQMRTTGEPNTNMMGYVCILEYGLSDKEDLEKGKQGAWTAPRSLNRSSPGCPGGKGIVNT